MKIFIYCRYALFQIDPPPEFGINHFRAMINMMRGDGYLSWATTDGAPCIYVPNEEILAVSMCKSDGEEIKMQRVEPQGRPN